MNILRGFFCLLSILIFNACSKTKEPVMIQRLDQELFAARDPKDVRRWLDNHKDVAQAYFGTTRFSQDTALVNELVHRVNDKELNVLYNQAHQTFGTLGDLTAGLSEAFTHIEENFPDFKAPRVAAVVTGFMGPDLVVSDSLVVIGLDYFIGPEAKYRPRDLPQYILRRYQQAYVVPAIVFALSDRYNATNRQDQTLLADMVYYGKGYVFTKQMLPDTPDSLVIGYSESQLTQTYNAQEAIWAYFIDAQLLYQTNPSVKNRYLTERPFTAEIGKQCPGAIARWIGWRIVGKYMDEKEPPIRELMENPNAPQLFELSGYKGLKEDED